MDFDAIVQEMQAGKNVKLSMLRVVFWKMLDDHHEGITLEDAKRILKRVSPLEMGTLLGRAIMASMPEAEAGAAGATPTAPGGQSGTGPASSVSGAASGVTHKRSGARRRASSLSSSTVNGIG
jgi:hypothetical protein